MSSSSTKRICSLRRRVRRWWQSPLPSVGWHGDYQVVADIVSDVDKDNDAFVVRAVRKLLICSWHCQVLWAVEHTGIPTHRTVPRRAHHDRHVRHCHTITGSLQTPGRLGDETWLAYFALREVGRVAWSGWVTNVQDTVI